MRRAWTSRSLACVCSLRGGVGRPLCIWIDSIAGRGLLFQRIRSILAGSPSLSPRNRSQHTPTVRWTTLNCSTPVVGRVWSVGGGALASGRNGRGAPLFVCFESLGLAATTSKYRIEHAINQSTRPPVSFRSKPNQTRPDGGADWSFIAWASASCCCCLRLRPLQLPLAAAPPPRLEARAPPNHARARNRLGPVPRSPGAGMCHHVQKPSFRLAIDASIVRRTLNRGPRKGVRRSPTPLGRLALIWMTYTTPRTQQARPLGWGTTMQRAARRRAAGRVGSTAEGAPAVAAGQA